MSSQKSTLSILRKTFGRYRWQILILAFLGFAGGILEGIGIGAIVPLLSFLTAGTEGMSNPITSAIAGAFEFVGVPFKFRTVIILIFILFFLRSIVLAVTAYIRASISASFMNREMGELASSTMHARWGFLLKQKAGYVQTTIIRDVQTSMNLFQTLAQAIQSFTGLAMYLVVAVSISWRITALTLILGSFVFLLSRPFIKKTRSIGEKTTSLEKSVSNTIIEHLAGLKTVKAAGEEKSVIGKIHDNLESLRVLFVKNAIVHSMGTVFIQPIGFLFIMVIFAVTYKTPGFSVAVFAATAYLIQKIFVYIDSGQNALHSINELAPYAGNINKYRERSVSATEHSTKAVKSFGFEKTIEFKDVSLSYEGRGEALSHINSTIQKGDVVGVVGPSGAGKTSFVDLLLRLFNPTDGAIYIDGEDLENISLEEWRKHVGYVSQDLFLLNETVEENIRFYDPSLSQKQIENAAKQAHIYDVIKELPDGFKTNIGDRGVLLSVGQRQRIVLARVLARQPDILVLDEATSALDSESEAFIKQTVKKLHGKITVIVVAHRLTTVMDVDNLFVIDKGKVVESGSPEKLLEDTKSYFHKLVHLRGKI